MSVLVGVERCGSASVLLADALLQGSLYEVALEAVRSRGGTVYTMELADANRMERCGGCRECGPHTSVG